MKDVTNEMVNPGKVLVNSTWLDKGRVAVSVVHYISGIEEFDKFLYGLKWANTRFDLHIAAYKEYLQFQIILERKPLKIFTIENKNVVNITARHDQTIEVSTKSSLSGALGVLTLAGILGGLVAATIESIKDIGADKIKTTSKEVKGSIYEITFKNEDETTEQIRIGVEQGHGTAGTNELFDYVFKTNLKKELHGGKGCLRWLELHGHKILLG